MKNKNETFKNELLQFEIDPIRKKCELKKEEKIQIQEWCHLKMKKIIFDSNIHNSKLNESQFDSLVLNKSNLLFLIQSDDDIQFGGFISTKINKIDKLIFDENAFAFTFKDNKPMKFNLKKDNKKHASFKLFDKNNERLFLLGEGDIMLNKFHRYSSLYENESCSFDYEGNKNVLIGKTGFLCLTLKRIIVIQMNN